MNTLLQNAHQLTINDPSMAGPLIEVLVRAAQVGCADTSDYDETLDFLFAKLPQFRRARDEYVEALSKAA
jgi:hypothetical protein